MTIIKSILEKMSLHLNISVVRLFPRHSVRFAKKFFGNKKIVAVEVGTFFGYNANNILKELNIERLFLVDPYKVFDSYDDVKEQEKLTKAENCAKSKLGRYKDVITWIKKSSEDAVEFLPKEIDFIYIDGNHNYEFAKKDMEDYFKILKKGGIMAGHDITGGFGVDKAFVEFCYENKLEPHISRIDWWVQK
jgi:predicted O-methyltransferase YrrM